MTKYNFSTGAAAESIANALSIRGERPINKNQVVVEPTKYAGQYLVTIYESEEFAEKVIPFLDKFGSVPTSFGELCLVGYGTNRKPVCMDPRQHGQVIGASTSGKSSLIHNMLAHATRCPDCVIWVGGVWKLYNFVAPWLEPYLNTGIRPPFDWVNNGHVDVCEMIAGALRVADYRMNLRINQRGHLPYIVLVLDEITYLVDNRMVRGFVNGEELSATELVAAVARGTAEAKIYEWLATQRDTQDNFGDSGGTTGAQMGFAFVFRIRDPGTVGRVTGDYTLPAPTARGECWADLGPDTSVVKLRVPYAQSPDPSKPLLHDGPKLDAISWSRRDIRHELDEGSALAAGPAYANRHQLVTEEFLTYLTTSKPVSVAPVMDSALPGGPGKGNLTAAQAEFDRMVQAYIDAGAGLGDEGEIPPELPELPDSDQVTPPGTVDMSTHRTRTARVLAIVQASDKPLGRTEIIEELRRAGDPVSSPQLVTNICGRYCKQDPPRMAKTPDDKYYAVEARGGKAETT